QHPTNAVPVRRWISSPTVVFDVKKYSTELLEKEHLNRPPQINKDNPDAFVLTDIQLDPKEKQTPTTLERYAVRKNIIDPLTGKKKTRYVSILESNEKKGETVYRASDVETLEEFIKTLK